MSIDFYSLYHKALRKKLFAVVELAGSADLDDAASRGALTKAVTAMIATVRAHSRAEDFWFQPIIARAAPAAHVELAREHEALEQLTSAIEAALAQALIEPTVAAGVRLYRALHRFTGAYLLHLLREEETMPLIAERVDAAELQGTYGAFLAARTQREMLADLELLLVACNGAERRQIVSRIPSLPPPTQLAAWELAGRLVGAAELARLRAAAAAETTTAFTPAAKGGRER